MDAVRSFILFAHYYLNLDENKQAKEQAQQLASYEVLEQAEQELYKIKDDSTNATVRRQSELYQHRLYLAKIKNRKELDLNYKDQANDQQAVVPKLEIILNNNK